MNKFIFRFLSIALTTVSATTGAQTLTMQGFTSVNVGETVTYSVSLGNISPVSSSWYAEGGEVQMPTTNSAQVLWLTADYNMVSCFIEDVFGNFYLAALDISVTVPIPNTTVSLVQNCGHSTITRNSNPDPHYEWFWQKSSSDVSTELGSASTLTITENQALYLRARTKNTFEWSTAQYLGEIAVIGGTPDAGSIGNNSGICPGSNASGLLSIIPATGDGITLQWQYSIDGSNWVNASSYANQPSYSPGILWQQTLFRRGATNVCGTAWTNPVTITMKPIPTVSLSPAAQQICSGQTMSPVTISNPSGNTTGTTLIWTVNAPNIAGASGGSGSSLQQTLSQTTTYDLTAIYTITPYLNGCSGAPSNVVVTVHGLVGSGSIGNEQILCSGAVPAALVNASTPSGGSGAYTYQWEQSINGGASWSNAVGSSTSINYAPPALTYTTLFKRTASSCGSSATTSQVTLTVSPQTAGGGLGDNIEAYGESSGTLSLVGHTGEVLKWQKKVGSGDWIDIIHTTASLQYTSALETTKYHAVVKSGACPAATSSDISIVIYPIPILTSNGGNTIAPGGTVTINCSNGFATYQWYKDGIAITGENLSSLLVTQPGSYNVSVKATNTSPAYLSSELIINDGILDQPTDKNYILTTKVLTPGVSESTYLYNLKVSDLSQEISYFDGMGRPLQSIQIGASPARKDMVQPVAYDHFGREPIKYLPYASDVRSGRHVEDPLAEQANFYHPESTVANDAFAVAIFENSPENRVLKQGAPGESWQPNPDISNRSDHSIKKDYDANKAKEIFLFIYNSSNGELSLNSDPEKRHYETNSLFANKTYDEHNHEIIEYTDKEGRVVCKKVQYDTEGTIRKHASTYYIYDDFGNLVVVLPPEAVKEWIALLN